MRRLPQEFKLVHLGLVSEAGGYRDLVERLINDPALNGRIKSLGQVPYDAVPGLLSGADLGIVCLVPDTENTRVALPNRFHDLVAAGVPIMTSPIEDVRRPVLDHGLGAVFDAIEPDLIAATLKDNRYRLGEYRANVIRYRETHVWEKEAEKLLALIGDRQRICVVVKKNITNHGRTHRIVASLVAAGKDVCVVAPTGSLPMQSARLSTLLVPDGLLYKG
jgi:glycosyltransferase involved in cell wall biosynthesis